MKKLTTENFIARARTVHGNKYNYSTSYFNGGKQKIIISCPFHGDFNQQATSHLMGNGCPKCVGRNKTTSEFISEANKIHNFKYDYSKFIYHKSSKKEIIICSKHGNFLCSPNNHLKEKGCPICAVRGHKKTIDEFVNKAIEVHNGKYDYSKSIYIHCFTKIKIICKIHGVFKQTPADHLYGKGCRKCALDPQINHSGFKRKEYILPNGKREFVQGYEPLTLDYLFSSNSIGPSDIIISGKEKPIISYSYLGRKHNYFPDCYLPTSNTIIETKSTYTWDAHKQQNLAKITGSIEAGFDIRIIIWNNKSNITSDVTYTK